MAVTMAATASAATIAIVNVNIIPMSSETVLAGKTVLVTDGRISTIGNVREVHIPEDVLVVDGTDRYLIPGLSEMHGHVPGLGTESLDRILHLYVANGVTLVRGMLGQPSHLQMQKQILEQEILGPRLYTSGPSFNGRSVSGPEQAREMVLEQKDTGYDFLKIHPGLNRAEFDEIARTANEVGIPFAGHVPADVGVDRALSSGIATIDHLDGYMQTLIPAHEDPTGGIGGFFGVMLAGQAETSRIASIVEATRLAGTWNVPTQTLFEHVVSTVSISDMLKWPEMRYMPQETVDQWVESKTNVIEDSAYDPEVATRAIELRRQIIKAMHDADARLLLGSDSPQIFNVPGFAIHRELQLLVDAGLTPFEALATGTVAPAAFFGRNVQSGTVEVGKDADLVLLDANPLTDISATRRVHGVMLRGRWVSNSEIKRLLEALER